MRRKTKFTYYAGVTVGILTGALVFNDTPSLARVPNVQVKEVSRRLQNLPRITTDNPAMRLISTIAVEYGLRPQFVKAIACKESICGQKLIAQEHSREWDKLITKRLHIPRNTPKYASLMKSYGILQISGAYAYAEDGYTPETLLDDTENIHYGCRNLRRLLDRCKGHTLTQKENCAAAAHNGGFGGRNGRQAQEYAAVIRYMINRG